jgi:hypothetical protein
MFRWLQTLFMGTQHRGTLGVELVQWPENVSAPMTEGQWHALMEQAVPVDAIADSDLPILVIDASRRPDLADMHRTMRIEGPGYATRSGCSFRPCVRRPSCYGALGGSLFEPRRCSRSRCQRTETYSMKLPPKGGWESVPIGLPFNKAAAWQQ